jgi:hypothetical protein
MKKAKITFENDKGKKIVLSIEELRDGRTQVDTDFGGSTHTGLYAALYEYFVSAIK